MVQYLHEKRSHNAAKADTMGAKADTASAKADTLSAKQCTARSLGSRANGLSLIGILSTAKDKTSHADVTQDGAPAA